MTTKRSWTGLFAFFLEKASHPNGVGNAELYAFGYTDDQVSSNMRHLGLREQIFAVGYRNERRYFTNKANADQYAAELVQIKAQKKRAKYERDLENRRLQPKKKRVQKARTNSLASAIRELASRPEGMDPGEIQGQARIRVSRNADTMPDVIGVGFKETRRYFTRQEDADRYAVQAEELRRQRQEAAREKDRARHRKPSSLRKPKLAVNSAIQGVLVPKFTGPKFDENQPTIIPKGVKVQKLQGHPGYDARYNVKPGAKVEGPFSKLPLGATLEGAQA